jgi:DNA replication protein DnaC
VGRYASALKVASEGYQADDRLGSCPLLLLDDLGEETASASSKIPAIVFERYDEGLPLWVTTSRPKDDLERRYGDGFVRRIFEGAAVIEVTGRKGQR